MCHIPLKSEQQNDLFKTAVRVCIIIHQIKQSLPALLLSVGTLPDLFAHKKTHSAHCMPVLLNKHTHAGGEAPQCLVDRVSSEIPGPVTSSDDASGQQGGSDGSSSSGAQEDTSADVNEDVGDAISGGSGTTTEV